MKELDIISIGEYFEMKDTSEYDLYVNTLKPVNLFAGKVGRYNKLSYDEVEVIKMVLNNPSLEDIKDVFVLIYGLPDTMQKSSTQLFLEQPIFDLFRAKIYLNDYFTNLVEREKNNLQGLPDEKMIRVNASERLGAVGHLLTKIRLGKQFGMSPKSIGVMNYNEIFSILVAEKRYQDVMKDYNEIK